MAAMAVILDFTIVDFSFLCSTSHPDASYLVKVNKPFGSGKEAKNTFFKMAARSLQYQCTQQIW